MPERPIIHSYGGGKQSVAIAVLYAAGKLPRPERIVIADTGREATATWKYLDAHVQPILSEVGLEVEIAPHSLATVDLYAKNGDLLMPAYTEEGKLPTFCSSEWKKRVVGRYLRSLGYGPENPVTEWMGFSLDEIGRCKPSGVAWRKYAWPLIFGRGGDSLTRSDCVRIVKEAGLPEPPKSSCYMCPYRRNSQWRDLRDNHPRDFRRAVELDESIRERDRENGGSGVYLHDSRGPLKDADLSERDKPQHALFGDIEECETGYCMV